LSKEERKEAPKSEKIDKNKEEIKQKEVPNFEIIITPRE